MQRQFDDGNTAVGGILTATNRDVADTTRTSLSGHMAELALEKRGKWFGSLDYKEVSPGFEINDVGFLSRADYRSIVPAVGYQANDPGRVFRSYSIVGASFDAWDFGNTMIRQNNTVIMNGTFNNLWAAGLQTTYAPDQLNDDLTRDVGAILREQPTNIFLVKATFWLAR